MNKKGAEIVLIMGESGSGKSTSARNLNSEKTCIIKPNSNSLPFPGYNKNYEEGKNLFITDKISDVKALLRADFMKKFDVVFIDDLNLWFNARTTSTSFIGQNAGNAAFAKWNVFAADVIQSFFKPAKDMKEGTTLIISAHTEVKDNGLIGIKTSGKLLDNSLKMQSYATYVLHALVLESDKDVTYKFLTNRDGIHEAKSPAGCLDKYIPNDLDAVVKRIKAYKAGDVKDIIWK